METEPKITTSDILCELHKCGAGLEINKKNEGKYPSDDILHFAH
jgi:hypothetical protein